MLFSKEYVLLISKAKTASMTVESIVDACQTSLNYSDPFFRLEESRIDEYLKKHLNEKSISVYVNEVWQGHLNFAGEFSFDNHNANANYFIRKDKFWTRFNQNPQAIIDRFYIVTNTFRCRN